LLDKFTLDTRENIQLSLMSPNFIWTDESSYKFQTALQSPDITNRLSNLRNQNSINSQSEIDTISDELTSIMFTAASASLKRKKFIKRSGKAQNRKKNGMMQNCGEKKKNLIECGKFYSKYPKDPLIKGQFYKLRK
jgi:hypothetical protein